MNLSDGERRCFCLNRRSSNDVASREIVANGRATMDIGGTSFYLTRHLVICR